MKAILSATWADCRREMFRAVRLVVDTGIHAERWTREKAIAYMLEKTGMGEKDVTSEIERYIVMPAQACAYKVGMLKMRELRTRAEQELGSKFDLREFHDTLLKMERFRWKSSNSR